MDNPLEIANTQIEPAPKGDMPKSWFLDPFTLLDNMGLGYRATPSSISYESLKQMASHNTMLAAIHNTRITQVANFCQRQTNRYSIGFKVRHKDPHRKYTRSELDFARDMEEMVLRCGWDKNPTRDDFVTFTKKVIRDRLRFDQINFEVVPKRNGKPHSFYAVAADTMRIKMNKKRGGPLDPHRAQHTPRYVQLINGVVVNEYSAIDLAWGVANPRTDINVAGYGYSEEEQLITTVTSHLWAEEWNRRMFSQGATTKGILNIQGNIPQQQLEAFRRQWLTQVSGVSNAWRTPIMNSEGLNWINLQPTNNEMGYQAWMEYLIKIGCAIYLIDPSEINFDTRSGVGTQPMFMTTNEAQQKVSKDRGLQPLMRHFASLLNKHLIEPSDDAWMLEFVGLDAKTEEQAIELRLKELQSYKTLNEVRREVDNLPPVDDGDVVLNATYIGYKSQLAMQKQQEQMMAAQGGAPPQGGGGQGQLALPPGPESLFGRRPEEPMPDFETAEQQAGAHINSSVQNARAKHPKNISETQTNEPEWARTVHAAIPAPDLKKGHRIDWLEFEE